MNKYPVMIVDDNEDDRYLLKRLLKNIKVIGKIFEADDGKTALDLFENYQESIKKNPDEFPPLLIFLDVNMPLTNGHEFLEKFNIMKKNTVFEAVVIMMFSSSEAEEDKENAFSYDFVKDFVSKGHLNSQELDDKINNCINPLSKV